MAHLVRVARYHSVVALRVKVAVRPALSQQRPIRRSRPAHRPARATAGFRAAHSAARKWRRRGRRAQVSAIATVLGLLLVVSFIANFLGTTLPAQMRVNDANHALAVENQLGRLATVLHGFARVGAVGYTVVQPVSLGSAGLAPFAAPDGARVTGIRGQNPSSVSLGVFSTTYNPPNGRGPNFGQLPSNCTNGSIPSAIVWNCNQGGVTVGWNFNASICVSLPPPCSIYVTTTGGSTLRLNYALNNSSFEVNTTGQGSGSQIIGLFGSNDTALFETGGGLSQNFTIIGDHNNVTINPTSSANVNVLIVGQADQVNFAPSGGTSNLFRVAGWGTQLRVNPGNGGVYFVNYTGFNPHNTTGLCPQGTLSGTDKVGLFPKNNGNGTATWLNNSPIPPGKNFSASNNNVTPKQGWWYVSRIPATQYACKFFATEFANAVSGLVPASLVVDLLNSYAPYAEVALDQGAVVYAQIGAIPYLVNPPPVQSTGGLAVVWTPLFLAQVPTQSGTGVATVSVTKSLQQTYVFPSNGWRINPTQPLQVVYATPYYQAWMNYFCGNPTFAATTTLKLPNALLPTGYTNPAVFSCATYLSSGAAQRPYIPGAGLGTVSVTIPATSVMLTVTGFKVGVSA